MWIGNVRANLVGVPMLNIYVKLFLRVRWSKLLGGDVV